MLPEPTEDTAEIGRKILGDTTVSEGKFKNDLNLLAITGPQNNLFPSVPCMQQVIIV